MPYRLGAFIVCEILIVILFFRVLSLERRVGSFADPNGSGIAAFQQSLKQVQAISRQSRN
jgi:hypothetical protein